MPVFFAALNSGSNGNCYYVGNDTEGLLIDAGISCRETEKRMRKLGVPIDRVKAIFISHEHIDHIKGVETLAKKYSLPVYITVRTWKQCQGIVPQAFTRVLETYQPVTIGSFRITGFPKNHDADDPHSFIINSNGINIGVFTDIGSGCNHVIRHFKQCHAAFLEANYDDSMLENGSYPFYLKKRISGEKGHLSNHQALEIFTKYRQPLLSHLILSHLSKENNDPQLVKQLFKEAAAGTEIIVASRYEQTALYSIAHTGEKRLNKKAVPSVMIQLGLFG